MNFNRLGILATIIFIFTVIPIVAFSADDGRRTTPGQKCKIKSLIEWSFQEKWVWNNVCEGKDSNFNTEPAYGGFIDPSKKMIWPKNRIISNEFLRTILFYEPFKSAITERGIRIIGAWFDHEVNLSWGRVSSDLWLDWSRFDSSVTLMQIKSDSVLSFQHSRVTGILTATNSNISVDLLLNNSIFAKGVVINGTIIGNQLNIEDSKVRSIVADSITVGKVYLDRCKTSEIHFVGAQVKRFLSMKNAKVYSHTNLGGMVVGTNVFLLGGEFQGNVKLNGSIVNGEITTKGSRFLKGLYLNGIKADKLIIHHSFLNDVDLKGAEITKYMSAYESKFQGDLDMYGMKIGGHLDLKKINVGKKNIINLSYILSDSNIDLRGGVLGSVNLQGAIIKGELRLSDNEHNTSWVDGSVIDLRNAKARRFGAGNDKGEVKNVHLNGFQYEGLGTEDNGYENSNETIKFLSYWLKYDKEELHSSQAHDQFAAVLKKIGLSVEAQEVLFDGKNHELVNEYKSGNYLASFLLFIQLVFIGYGYQLWIVVYWIVGLVVVGTYIAYTSGLQTKDNKRLGWWYSIDHILPFIELRKEYYDIELIGWREKYYYIHTILGYLLASLLLAKLTGLV